MQVANAWLAHRIPYDWTANTKQYVTSGKGLYRADCSGFVSAAWNVPPPGSSTRDIHVTHINVNELRRCDAFLYQKPGGVGHIALFWDWAVKGSQPIVVEECGHTQSCCGSGATCPGKCGTSGGGCNEYCPGCPIQKRTWSSIQSIYKPVRNPQWS